MKKIVALLLVIAMAVAFAFTAFADTQSEKDRLIKALENYEIKLSDGTTIKLKDTDINAAKNFLSAYDGEVTPDMVDEAIANLDAAAAVVKNSKTEFKTFADLKKLSQAEKNSILEKANDAVEAFDLNVSLNNTNGKVEFKDDTGAVKYEATTALKKTGPVSPVYAVAGFVLVALAGCAVLTKKYALSK